MFYLDLFFVFKLIKTPNIDLGRPQMDLGRPLAWGGRPMENIRPNVRR